MKTILQNENTYILKIKRGEEVVEQLKQFCKENNITAAHFSLIGAAEEVELAWYNLEKKEYETKLLKEDLEITGVLGNIAMLDGETVVHSHGTFSDRDFKVYAGHVNKMLISGACEVTFHALSGMVERKYDDETGLNLLH